MTEQDQPTISRSLLFAQWWLGLGSTLCLAVPYLRRAHGMERLHPGRRYLFVANHVSLLDSILLGALCWRSGCYPILVLGDRHIWRASWIRRLISTPIAFLLERNKPSPSRIRELQTFARAGREFHLVVFPEGTRGDGVQVGPCRPGIYFIAQESLLPIVPVFFENMQLVSTKTGRFHPIGGLRKVEVHFGEVLEPEKYRTIPRDEFLELVRGRIGSACLGAPASLPACQE